MKIEFFLNHTVKLTVALIILGATAMLSNADVNDADKYRVYYGDHVAVEVSTKLTEKDGEYVVNRVSIPKSAVARMVADQITEDSYVDASEGFFRTREYHYSELGGKTIKAIVGADDVVRLSNGKEFKLENGDIVIDMGSLQYVFKFLTPNELANKRVKVITNKRVDVYKFSDVSEVSIEVDSRHKQVKTLNISAHDVNRPGRYSEFWLDPENDMHMVKMVQQSEKQRLMLPNSVTLKSM